MAELFMFLIVLIGISIYDLWKMKKATLKKEVLPYLAMTLLSAAVGLIYLINPFGPSISKILFDLFNIKE